MLRDRGETAVLVRNEIKRISLKEMLRWAYNRQQADTLSGKLIDGDQAAFMIGGVGGDMVSRFSALGTRVDSGGSNRFARNDIHPDAELLHDRVLELGAIDARLVVQFGHTGTYPEAQEPVAYPQPPLPGDRYGTAIWRGERTRYRQAVAEVVVERFPVYANEGRKGVRLVYTETIRTEVLFSPISWHPDPRWCAVTLEAAAHWYRVIAALRERVRAMLADPGGARFTEHEIVDLGASV